VTTFLDAIGRGLAGWRDDIDRAAAELPIVGGLFARDWRVLRFETGKVTYTNTAGDSLDIPAAEEPAIASAEIARLGKKGPLVLRIAGPLGFRRIASFPVAARKHLDEAIELALPRLSPLPASDIVFAADRTQLEETDGRISLPVSIIRRSTLETALARANGLGLEPAAVDLEDNGREDNAPALDLRDGRSAPAAGRSAFTFAGIACGILIAATAALLVDQAIRLDPAYAEARRPASLEARLEAAITHAEDKARSGSVTAALADLSRRLPDGAYVTSFAYDNGNVRISGLAWDAAAALRALDAADEFTGAAFDGATVRDEETGRERFELTARHRISQRENGS
jgi:hypothetical protein